VRFVDAMNFRLGRIVMYGIFAMVGVLLWSSFTKTFFIPARWTLEVAQFSLVAYYMLGGPYSIQLGANVRMDLFYGSWSIRKKAWIDVMTIWFLIFYLGVLFYGAVGSAAYSLGYFGDSPFTFFWNFFTTLITGGWAKADAMLGFIERSPTSWRPYLWPVKALATVGVFLMLLQAISEFLKDMATLRGLDWRIDQPVTRMAEKEAAEEAAENN